MPSPPCSAGALHDAGARSESSGVLYARVGGGSLAPTLLLIIWLVLLAAAVAKRLECVRLQRRFPKAGCDSMAMQVHGKVS